MARATRLDNDRNALLLYRFLCGTRCGWQLEHSRPLTFAQTCEQNHLPIREFKRIMVRDSDVQIDPPKARES